MKNIQYSPDKPEDCRYCFFWKNRNKRANETGSIYEADIKDLQERLDGIWTDMKEVLVRLSAIQ